MTVLLINITLVFSIFLSLSGLGKFLMKTVNFPFNQFISLNVIAGLSFFTLIFGILDLFHASYKFIFIFIFLFGIFFLIIRKNYFFLKKYLTIVNLFLFIIIFSLFIIFSKISINFSDDVQSYLLPIKSIIDNNFKGDHFFNYRLNISPFYTYSYFYSLFFHLGLDFISFKIIDLGFGILLLSFLLIDFFFKEKNTNVFLLLISFLVLVFIIILSPIYANTTPLILGAGVFLGTLFLIDLLRNIKDVNLSSVFCITLFFIYLISLKNTYLIPGLLIFVLIIFLFFQNKKNYLNFFNNIIYFLIFSVIILLPHLISSYLHTGNVFYPLLGKQNISYHLSNLNDDISFNHWINHFFPYILLTLILYFFKCFNKKTNLMSNLFFLLIAIMQIFLIYFGTKLLIVNFRHMHSIVLIPTFFLFITLLTSQYKLKIFSKVHNIILIFIILFFGAFFSPKFLVIKNYFKNEVIKNSKIFFDQKNKNLNYFPKASINEYYKIQNSLQNDLKALIIVEYPVLFDFKKNLIYAADLFGTAGFKNIDKINSADELRKYLLKMDISYIVYSYNSRAGFTKSIEKSKINSYRPEIKIPSLIQSKFLILLEEIVLNSKKIYKTDNNLVIEIK